MTVCRFAPEKNLVRLIAAFARYREQSDRGAAWDLVLCGDGPPAAEVDRRDRRQRLVARDPSPGLPPGRCAIALLRSRRGVCAAEFSEPWGLVVNEAAASGLPLLVSSRAGCAATLVPEPEGTTGGRFDPLDSRK